MEDDIVGDKSGLGIFCVVVVDVVIGNWGGAPVLMGVTEEEEEEEDVEEEEEEGALSCASFRRLQVAQ